jgi:hypothetical protein
MADVIGRYSTQIFSKILNRNWLLFLTCFRFLFIISSILIGIKARPKSFFENDWTILINTFLIGFGNG